MVASDLSLNTEHRVLLTGLDSATRYFYSIGDRNVVLSGPDDTHLFITAPVMGSTAATRIWVVGDSGTANAWSALVRDAYETYAGSRPTDLWLMLGDNAYPSGTDDQYQAAVFDTYPELLRRSVLWPALGNHDGISADSASETGPYYDIFELPRAGEAGGVPSGTEAYYSFDHANVHFVCLDSHESDRSVGGAMATWLASDLAATTQDWKVVFFHHPPYTKGSHDSVLKIRDIEMRENFNPILEAAGCDLVLGGHSHGYERSLLVHGHFRLNDF